MGCSSWNIHSQKESLSLKKYILLKWISVVQRRIWSRLADNRCDRHWFMSDHNQSTNFPIPFGRGVGGGVGGVYEILSFFISHARDWWPTLWGSKQQQQTSGGKTKMVKRRWRKKIKKKKRGRGGGGGGGGGRGEKKSLKEDDENKCFASL